MLPDLPEIVVIFIICVATFGLGKLDKIGEFVWRIRCRLSPALESDSDGPTPGDSDGDEDGPTR